MRAEEVAALLNHQRHDILNHLQVIGGYLELGYSNKASAYLGEVLEELDQERELFKLYNAETALFLHLHRLQAREYGINLKYRQVVLAWAGDLAGVATESLSRMRGFLSEISKGCGQEELEVAVVGKGDTIVFRIYAAGKSLRDVLVTGGDTGVR